jgi:hypothetical protein
MQVKNFSAIIAAGILSLVSVSVHAAPVVYTNNAGTPLLQSFDTTTGARINSFTAPGGNGRGVVVVGDKVYTTEANSGNVRVNDRVTGAPLAGGFTVAGATGLSTITFDGDNFWISDYTGTNKAFKVSPTGALLSTITLSKSQGNYDGLEYFNGKLIANRFDGGNQGGNQYSVYDLTGTLITENFIDTTGHGNGTGIAFDGTDFYIADIFNSRLSIWNGTTGAYKGELKLLNSANVIEDLSFDFGARIDTCRVNCGGGDVPLPATLPLILIGAMGSFLTLRRRKL